MRVVSIRRLRGGFFRIALHGFNMHMSACNSGAMERTPMSDDSIQHVTSQRGVVAAAFTHVVMRRADIP
jgi:hypothetical protein